LKGIRRSRRVRHPAHEDSDSYRGRSST
jgi:hypothetical protein